MREIFVTKSSMPSFDEYIEEIRDIWDTGCLTNSGPKHKKFSELLREYLNVQSVELFVNCHMSLELAIQALELHGEIITTPFTFISTTHAITRNGIKPIFCDVNPIDYTIDVNKIEDLITDKTSAIMPVHVYGHVCDVESIERIAEKHNLKVIYDAAHCFGISYQGKGIGSYGDISCFSFHATKVFNSIEGGAATFKSESIGEKLRALRNFGMPGHADATYVGANAKMHEFSAAMGICNLRHVKSDIEKRKVIVERYRRNLENCQGIVLPPTQKGVKSNYAYFPVLINEESFGKSREEVFLNLEANSIHARKYFSPLTCNMSAYEKYERFETPVAERLSREVLTLPLYSDLNLSEVDRICECILRAKKI